METYQEYPDPMPSQEDIMAAMDIVMAENPEFFVEKAVLASKDVGVSMAGIYQRLLRKVVSMADIKGQSVSTLLYMIQKVKETPEAKKCGSKTLRCLDLPQCRQYGTILELSLSNQYCNANYSIYKL